MPRHVYLALVLALLVAAPDQCAAQTTCAPLYALPADGTWVEYVWKATGTDGQQQGGTLRLASVGSKEVQGVRHRWVEIRKETGQGKESTCQVRRLLVAEKAFRENGSLQGNVAEALAQDSHGGPVTALEGARLEEFVNLGISGPEAALRTVADRVEVETPLGKFITRQVSARGKRGERLLEYRGWLTEQVPFGWARFEIHETAGKAAPRTVFTAVATRCGQDARSEPEETRGK
jgi:hypothetical protein